MGMNVIINIVDEIKSESDFEKVFKYLRRVDERFSLYKKDSEISKINRGKIKESDFSPEMREVFDLSEKTRLETNNYFNIKDKNNLYDTNGMVKGWAIYNASKILREIGYKNFLIDIGSDIEIAGLNDEGEKWSVGIKNPFKPDQEIIKVLYLTDCGIATSGKYATGDHIYNPNDYNDRLDDLVSVTVIAKNVYEADRFATAVFAMGNDGINFLEKTQDIEGYVINKEGIATMSTNFEKYLQK